MKSTIFHTFMSIMTVFVLGGCGGSGSSGVQESNGTDITSDAFSQKILLPFYDHEHDTEIWVTDGTTKGTSMLKDINTWPRSASVWYLKKIGDKIYFQANDGTHGIEVWETDGTQAGTKMLKDISGDHGSSMPRWFTGDNEKFFFQASGGTRGVELWVSDGTTEGTHLVKDIRKDGNSNPSSFTVLGEKVFFVAYDGIHGTELWVSDGTTEGTHLVKDINKNKGASLRRLGFTFRRKLYFSADDGIHGTELWVSDGTDEGTRLLKDISPGASNSDCRDMVQFGEFFYFIAHDSNYNYKLWESDGTEDGTMLVLDSKGNTIKEPYAPTVVGNKIYFGAKNNQGVQGVWISDGSAQGTHMLKDSGKSYAFTASGRYVYFSADGDGHGRELWRTDGTAEGTKIVKDIYPGGNSSAPAYLSKGREGKIYFRANDGRHGMELWISDGTELGTKMVKDIRAGETGSYIQFMKVLNEKVYFVANTDKHRKQLWVSDGTADGTHILKLLEDGNSGIQPYRFGDIYYTRLKGKHYFSTFLYDKERAGYMKGYALWKSDGTAEGTEIIAEHEDSNPISKNFFSLKTVKGKILMLGHDADHGKELWVSDGSEEGTHLLKDIYSGEHSKNGSHPSSFVGIDDKVYFSAADEVRGRELWVSDATENGTHIVKDINPGKNDSSPYYFSVSGKTLYFSAFKKREVWMSDGTEKGTHKLIDNSVLEGQTITMLKAAGDTLWIGTKDKDKVYHLWVSHPSKQTVVKLADSNIFEFYYGTTVLLNDKFFFLKKKMSTVGEEDNIFELWSNDGTDKGSKKVRTFKNCSSLKIEQVTLSDKFFLYEWISDSVAGRLNIWASDGTQDNTEMVVKSAQGGYVSGSIDDEILFNVFGREYIKLYRTDGTTEGTKLIKSNRW